MEREVVTLEVLESVRQFHRDEIMRFQIIEVVGGDAEAANIPEIHDPGRPARMRAHHEKLLAFWMTIFPGEQSITTKEAQRRWSTINP